MHSQFLTALGKNPETEDPWNKLLDVDTQLGWLRSIGFEDVDCYWKWRELARESALVALAQGFEEDDASCY